MTETVPRVVCETMIDSPLDEGGHLVCFRSPHAYDPWHFDNRGAGVSFRDDGTALVGVLPGAPAEQVLAAQQAVDDRLPAPLGDADGQLDLDAMRTLAPQIRDGLIASLRHSATLLRQGRGTVVVPEDTFDLVRRVTAAEEVLRQWAQAFTAAAAECVAIAEEEALTANGSYPGVEDAPSASLFVPDGAGQRIAVRPDWKPGESTYDVATLVEWLIDEEVAEVKGERRAEARARYESRQAAADPNGEGIEPEPLDPIAAAAEAAWFESDARYVAGQVVARLLSLGRYTPGAKALDELRKRLASQQRDSDAAVIRQVRSVGPRKYAGVKVTREDA